MTVNYEYYLIDYLKEYNNIEENIALEERLAVRALMNITNPKDLDDEYYEKQDAYLKALLEMSTVEDAESLVMIEPKIALWYGDITLIKADAIVNSAMPNLEGCYVPLHASNDNAIHSFAGLQLRRDCISLMQNQDEDEKCGKCKVTKGYNLPCTYVFHTVGPRVIDEVTSEMEKDLKNCYLSCLRRAEICKSKTLVFPLISAIEYNFPLDLEVKIAVDIIRKYLEEEKDTVIEKVVLCASTDYEYEMFEKYLTKPQVKLVKKFSK